MRSTVNTYPFQPAKVAPVTFTERIRAMVEKAGDDDQSKRRLAKRLKVSHTTLARYAQGGQPRLDTAILMADALGITLDELAGRSPDRSRKPHVVSIDGVLYQPVSASRDEPAGDSGAVASAGLKVQAIEAARRLAQREGAPLEEDPPGS